MSGAHATGLSWRRREPRVFCDDAGPIVRRKYEAHAREKRRACVREEGAYARTRDKHASGACGRAVSAGLARVRGGEQTTGALARKRREGRVSSMGLVAPLCNERAGVQQARRRESRRGLYGHAAAGLGQTDANNTHGRMWFSPKTPGGDTPPKIVLPRRGFFAMQRRARNLFWECICPWLVGLGLE